MGCMGRNAWKNETFRVKINSKTRGMKFQVVLTLKTRLSIVMSVDVWWYASRLRVTEIYILFIFFGTNNL